jgi:hypothetical protein
MLQDCGITELTIAQVRTAKFFVGYDFFGFCPYTLAIRIRTKSEPLTQPALCKIDVSVFIPARRMSAAIDRSTNQPVFFGPEVCYISSFTVENYNGVTLGDFQRAFEKW